MNRPANDPRLHARATAPTGAPSGAARGLPGRNRFPPRGGGEGGGPLPPQRGRMLPVPGRAVRPMRGGPILPPLPASREGRMVNRGGPMSTPMMPMDGRGPPPMMRGGRNVRSHHVPAVPPVPMGRGGRGGMPGGPVGPLPPPPPPPPPHLQHPFQRGSFPGRMPGRPQSRPAMRPPFSLHGGPMPPHLHDGSQMPPHHHDGGPPHHHTSIIPPPPPLPPQMGSLPRGGIGMMLLPPPPPPPRAYSLPPLHHHIMATPHPPLAVAAPPRPLQPTSQPPASRAHPPPPPPPPPPGRPLPPKSSTSSSSHHPHPATNPLAAAAPLYLSASAMPPVAAASIHLGTAAASTTTASAAVSSSSISIPVQTSTITASSASTTTTNPTSEKQVDVAWTEHSAPTGMKYYYNSVTRESTYLKPDALKQSQAIPPPPTTTTTTWHEYNDTTTGRTYYSDGVRTTWEKPAELQLLGSATAVVSSTTVAAADSNMATSNVQESSSKTPDSPQEAPKKKKRKKETEFGNKEEAVAAFKGLLLAKDVAPTLKWNEVAKICAADARWEACEDVLTMGERKQALAEYQTKRANELREIERQERARAKQAFAQMLSVVLPSVSGFSCWNSRFADVRGSLSKDDRFYAVAEEATRESLFLDFCEECKKRDERKKRNNRRDAQDAFLSFLKEKEDYGELTYASTWESFFASLRDTEKADSRFALLPERSNEDRHLYFADFVLELQAKEDDKRRRIRDARQRAQHEQKDSFLESLAQLAIQGKLLPASRWRNVEDLVSCHPSFAPMKAQDRESPREIFEEFVNEWNNNYRRDRTFLSQLVYPSAKSDVLVKADTTFEEFSKALLERASESSSRYDTTRGIINREVPVSSARLYFNELSMRARGVPGPVFVRRGSSSRRGKDSDSSEDEGEIIEDGEIILE